jgi:hypothetical protein
MFFIVFMLLTSKHVFLVCLKNETRVVLSQTVFVPDCDCAKRAWAKLGHAVHRARVCTVTGKGFENKKYCKQTRSEWVLMV